MASGVGVDGTVGRCYGFYADFKQCLHEATLLPVKEQPEELMICQIHRSDYFECLHGYKENARKEAVLDELWRQRLEEKKGISENPTKA